MFRKKIPLAWLQLSREKARMAVALAGIAFADVLMFLQLGIRDALFDGAVALHQSLEGEIVLISSDYKALISLDQFSQRRLYQTLGFTGVKSVSPIYLDSVYWKNPENKESWGIFVIGFNPEEKVLNLPGIKENIPSLKQENTVLFDRGSRKEFGQIVNSIENQQAIQTELNNRRINVVGLFNLGTSFGVNGNVITSDVNFLRLFNSGRRQYGLIDFGLIKLEDDADVNWVLENLRSNLPKDVKVLSKEELIAKEKSFWNASTPVGFIFTLGAIIGFVVGAVIVYQILYSDVSDHLPEYATLKAMGFKSSYLLTLVFQEALILALIGFIPGFAISQALYLITRQATLLPILMTVERAVFIFIVTNIMCSISALIAMQKLQAADPADVF
ncbi:MAG: FtsX-like permease family protein [Sphaerospermopsis sp. SIO1G1]|nr:FtsX-like permease family protein [Sphaerospermopsis sp. SIO1G1]